MIADSLPNSPNLIAEHMDGQLQPLEPGRLVAFLPSPNVQNHAAFLLRDRTGTLTCAWFAGALEGKADICIFTSILNEETVTWGAAHQVSDDPERSEQNPVLFDAPDGRRLLFHTAQPSGDQDRCIVRMRTLGERPRDILFPLGSFVRGRPIVRKDGAWLLPLFHCTHAPGARWTGRHDTASVAITEDKGESWRLVAVPNSIGCVHMTLVPLSENNIVAFFRRRQADFVYRCETKDGGETWSDPCPTDLPNNNSSISAIVLADGRIAVVCNPVNADMDSDRRQSLYDELGEDDRPEAEGGCTPIWGVRRAPLILALSTDDGISFSQRITVLDGPGTCLSNNSEDGKNKEFSYPALSQNAKGDIDVCFTYHRRAIAHIRVPASELGEQE